MRFSSEDHFQHELTKRFASKGWSLWREMALTKARMRGDVVVLKETEIEGRPFGLLVWVEAKTKFGMHEWATALGQVLTARSYIRDINRHLDGYTGGKAEAVFLIAIPKEIFADWAHLQTIGDEFGIKLVHEDNILEHAERRYSGELESRTAVQKALSSAINFKKAA